MSSRFYTTEEVAKHFGITTATVFRYMKDEDIQLNGFKAGKSWKFTEEDVELCEQRLRARAQTLLKVRSAKMAAANRQQAQLLREAKEKALA